MPVYGRWMLNAFRTEFGNSLEPQRFSTTDPRQIGEHVTIKCAISNDTMNKKLIVYGNEWDDPNLYNFTGDTVTVRIPVRKPLKLEVTANG